MDNPGLGPISPRETEVLAALAEHRTNAQIANRLHISVRTVESHVSSLLRKLGAADRQALAGLAGPRPPGPGVVTGVPPGHTTFVGRRPEHDAVVAALAKGRLVSLLGPGGMGKTRLAGVVATAAAAAFPAGAAFVDLVPARPGQAVLAVAAGLGVVERPPQPLDHAIAALLATGRFLLVLDNCEHVVDDVAELVAVIQRRCPNTTILATTRRRLAVPGERVVRLGPLAIEPDAVRLFFDRARAIDGELDIDPATAAAVCRGLDGMPLAIEIAAARAASLGPDGLRAAAADRLRLLRGGRGVHPRHASLEAVMSWSYDLLDSPEQAVLRALSVFAGPFDLAAAAAVTGEGGEGVVADLLGRLCDGSLVVRDGRRTWRLLETVRAFAAARLDADQRARVQDRYIAWAAATAARLAEHPGDAGTGLTAGKHPAEDPRDAGTAFITGKHPAESPSGASPGFGASVRSGQRPSNASSGSAALPRLAEHPGGVGREGARPAQRPNDAGFGFAAVAADLRAALAATAAAPDPVAHELAVCLARVAFAEGYNREARGHFLTAADRAADTAQAVADLRAAAAVATAVYDGPAAVELLLAAADRAGSAGLANDAAAATASAVIVALRFPGEFGQRLPPKRASRLLAAATRDADSADRRTAALIAAARAWTTGPDGFAGEALALAREADDPVLLLGVLDVAMTGSRRRTEVGELLAERLDLIDGLPRHDPAAATEITDTFHVAVSCAMAGGDLRGAESLLAAAAARDPLAGHPYVTAPRRIRLAALLGRFDEATSAARALWDEWRRDGAPTRRWMATAPAMAALAEGLRGGAGETVRPSASTGAGSPERWRRRVSDGIESVDATGSLDRWRQRALEGTETADATGSPEWWRQRALEIAGTDDATASLELAACMAFVDARLAVHTGRLTDAEALVERGFTSFDDASVVPHPAVGGSVWEGYARAAAAELAVLAGLPDAAERVAVAGASAEHNRWAAACLDRARGRLNGDGGHFAAAVERWDRIGARFERACTLALIPKRRAEGVAELEALGATVPGP